MKPDPVMVIVLPPFSGPAGGLTESISGAPKRKVLSLAATGMLPIRLVGSDGSSKRTSTVVARTGAPAAAVVALGAVTIISVSETTVAPTPLMPPVPVSPAGSKYTLFNVRPASSNPEPMMVTWFARSRGRRSDRPR